MGSFWEKCPKECFEIGQNDGFWSQMQPSKERPEPWDGNDAKPACESLLYQVTLNFRVAVMPEESTRMRLRYAANPTFADDLCLYLAV